MEHPSWIIFFVISLILTAIFSAGETALKSSNQSRIKDYDDGFDDKDKLVEELQDALEETDKVYISLEIATTLFSIISIVLFAAIIREFNEDYYMLITIVFMPLILLIFGKMTPKKIAKFRHEGVLKIVKPVISLNQKILSPLVFLLDNLTSFISRILGANEDFTQPIITQDELRAIVDFSGKEGLLEDSETSMIRNIFDFGDMTISDIMVQRMDIVAVDVDDDYDTVIKTFKDAKLSRLVVYDDTIDDVRGFLYAKDMFYAQIHEETFTIEDIMRPPYYTYEFNKISELFDSLRNDNSHIAVVLDEYGGVAGVVTMEDVLESIVGDIYDEYDEEERDIIRLATGDYIIEAEIKLEDLADETGIIFESEDYESLGGYILEQNDQQIPKKGQTINTTSAKIIVLEITKNKIGKVKVVPNKEKQVYKTDEENKEQLVAK